MEVVDHRASIASAIRGLRKEKGLTGPELAKLAGVNQATISRIETGSITPRMRTLESVLAALEAPPHVHAQVLDHLRALHSELSSWESVIRAGLRRKQEEVQDVEASAENIRLFQPAMIPGLLQTTDYARSVFQDIARTHGVSAIDDAFQARIERQKILLDTDKRFSFVITEGALRWRYCPADVMAAQLDHIASLSHLANLSIGIITWSTEVPMVPLNPFGIFDRRLVIIETYANELVLHDARDVDLYTRSFEVLQGRATLGEEARAVLAQIAGDYRALPPNRQSNP